MGEISHCWVKSSLLRSRMKSKSRVSIIQTLNRLIRITHCYTLHIDSFLDSLIDCHTSHMNCFCSEATKEVYHTCCVGYFFVSLFTGLGIKTRSMWQDFSDCLQTSVQKLSKWEADRSCHTLSCGHFSLRSPTVRELLPYMSRGFLLLCCENCVWKLQMRGTCFWLFSQDTSSCRNSLRGRSTAWTVFA